MSEEQKILTFYLGDELLGMPILKTKEIIGMTEIVKVPNSPDYIKGVINIRGSIIPLMDLRLRCEMPERAYDERTCIVIVAIEICNKINRLGIVVDSVAEVVNMPAEDIGPPPEFGSSERQNMIMGMGKLDDHVIIILDVDKVAECEEIQKIISKNNQ